MLIQKARFFKLIIVSLVVLLSSSSFFLRPYLTKIIIQGQPSESQLSFALKKKNTSALSLLVKQQEVGSPKWLRLMINLAHQQGSSAYQLARWYDEKIALSDLEFKLSVKHQTEAVKWYKQSIRLHYEKAKTSLAYLYLKQSKFEQVELLLSQVDYGADLSVKIEYFIVKISLAIETGDEEIVLRLIEKQSRLLRESLEGQELLEQIYRYKVINRTDISSNTISSNNNNSDLINELEFYKSSCISSVQLFASTLNDLAHIENMQKKFKFTPLSTYICLPPPRYFPKKLLNCSDDITKPITCDETVWQKVASTISTRHIGFMKSEGGANVHLGILYFDKADDFGVFTHELTHLLGFIDEYPISKKHKTCQDIQQYPLSHNISILAKNEAGLRLEVREKILAQLSWAHAIKTTTPILTKRSSKGWVLGTPDSHKDEVGLFKANTCSYSVEANDHQFHAFKAIARSTHLEYYAELIPQHYLDQLNNQPRDFLMPSFHYNLALALYKKGNVIKAKYWLKQSSLWERSDIRKDKILKGIM